MSQHYGAAAISMLLSASALLLLQLGSWSCGACPTSKLPVTPFTTGLVGIDVDHDLTGLQIGMVCVGVLCWQVSASVHTTLRDCVLCMVRSRC